jgi:hypothetical protein
MLENKLLSSVKILIIKIFASFGIEDHVQGRIKGNGGAGWKYIGGVVRYMEKL